MANTFFAGNGAEPTTVSRVAVSTGTAIKTLLQVATPATRNILLVSWGISFDGVTSTAVPGICELLETDVAASGGTVLTPTRYFDPNGPLSLCVGGAALTCFSPTAEGAITAARTADVQHISPASGQYVYQWPLGREFKVGVSKFLRVRVKFAAAVNAMCWVQWEE